jgi:hypothetical protein
MASTSRRADVTTTKRKAPRITTTFASSLAFSKQRSSTALVQAIATPDKVKYLPIESNAAVPRNTAKNCCAGEVS